MPKAPPPNERPRQGSARQRSAAFRAAERRAERRRRVLVWSAATVVIIAAAVGITAAIHTSAHHAAAQQPDNASVVLSGPVGPEGIAVEQGQQLATPSTAANGQTIDGIQCNASEQVAYHIHTHLTVYVNGALRPIPPGIGIVTPVTQHTVQGPFDSATRCYYWLHVHTQDGIIHVESPNNIQYNLGQFFAIWQQPLTADQVGASTGQMTVFINGIRYTGDPAAIPLRSREDIQIDVGTPAVAPKRIDWSQSQL